MEIRNGSTFRDRSGPGTKQNGRRIIEHGAELILREEPVAMAGDSIPIGDVSRPSATLMLAPIRNRTKVIGILSIHSYTLKAYNQSDLNTLQTLADHCGGALERIRAEQALRESEQRFRDLFECSPDAIFVEDFNGIVLDVNPAACQLHGVAREELIGKTVAELVPSELEAEVIRDFQALVDGRLRQIEGVSRTRDGRTVPVEVSANHVDYGGRPAVSCMCATSPKESSPRPPCAVPRCCSLGMAEFGRWDAPDGRAGKYCGGQRGILQTRGDAPARVGGQAVNVIYAESERPEQILQKYRQRFHDRVIERQIERKLTLRNGTVVTFEDTNSFVELRGQPSLLLGLFRDVTAQKTPGRSIASIAKDGGDRATRGRGGA